MSTVEQILKKNRPNLSQGSIRTYTSIIKNLGKEMKQDFSEPQFILKHHKEILEHLENTPPKLRKTRLASLVVFLSKEEKAEDVLKKFRELMADDRKVAEDESKEQKLTDRQKQGWVDWDFVLQKYEELKKEVTPLLKQSSLDKKQFNRVQIFVLLSCLILIPPRRSLDWTSFKIRNVDKEKDNHLELIKKKPYFIFNTYKTVSKYGQQKELIPNNLHQIIKSWIKLNPNDYLLMNYNQSKSISPTQLTHLLHGFFDKPISTSLLRHIYLTHKYGNLPAIKEMEATASSMGHSLNEALTTYVKKE